VSLIARSTDAGYVLSHGSVILGGSTPAAMPWPEWHERECGHGESSTLKLLALAGSPSDEWTQFDHALDGWRMLRFLVPGVELPDWLTRAVSPDGSIRVGTGDVIQVNATAAEAVIRVLTGTNTSTGRLAAMVARPLVGWMHPLTATEKDGGAMPPDEWAVNGISVRAATTFLTGIAVTSYDGCHPAHGLLIAKTVSVAWIRQLRGGPQGDTFSIRAGLDPEQIAMWDLVVDMEEFDSDDNLVAGRRVALADLELPSHGADDITIELPAVGSDLKRNIRVFHRDGRLLDAATDVRILRAIHLTIQVNDGEPQTTIMGDEAPPSTLVTRLAAVDAADEAFDRMLEQGVPNRLVLPGDDGRTLLAKRLSAARGELSIFDPYFHRDVDWDVLRQVTVPMRLITTRKPETRTLVSGLNINIRVWRGGDKAPFHDRGYLWQGGGLAVGTTPSSLGDRLSLIDEMSTAVHKRLTQEFELWWNDVSCKPL